eukprot:scaffold59637_cov23-Prasinocladus_malaysianus.AAC.1
MRVAEAFEKIRVNPGNFVDGRKSFDDLALTEESFQMAKEQIREVCAHAASPHRGLDESCHDCIKLKSAY